MGGVIRKKMTYRTLRGEGATEKKLQEYGVDSGSKQLRLGRPK